MDLTLKIWRQANAKAKGKMVDYKVSDISPDSSFFEMNQTKTSSNAVRSISQIIMLGRRNR